MEYVDVYDNKGDKLGYTKERDKLERGENRLSCFAWIINDKKEISEIPFWIEIKIENANKNCPINYKIYDCNTNTQIEEKNKIFIDKNEEILKKYKVIGTLNKEIEADIYDDINIVFNIEQAN